MGTFYARGSGLLGTGLFPGVSSSIREKWWFRYVLSDHFSRIDSYRQALGLGAKE
ncbi:hypothetical protein BJ956_000417 [Arthrobacter psychrochitiniphilus]|nr:hypothetical protein [Arthrobacter psychrochitiniphilus]